MTGLQERGTSVFFVHQTEVVNLQVTTKAAPQPWQTTTFAF
jgi:hypothetical protein